MPVTLTVPKGREIDPAKLAELRETELRARLTVATWACDLCHAANAEMYEFCGGCGIGERRVCYDNQRPLTTVDGRGPCYTPPEQ